MYRRSVESTHSTADWELEVWLEFEFESQEVGKLAQESIRTALVHSCDVTTLDQLHPKNGPTFGLEPAIVTCSLNQ